LLALKGDQLFLSLHLVRQDLGQDIVNGANVFLELLVSVHHVVVLHGQISHVTLLSRLIVADGVDVVSNHRQLLF
jgi:streptomycin 6-kinase